MSKNIKNEIICSSSSTSTLISPYYYQNVNLTFSGAIDDDAQENPMIATVTLERIANTVSVTMPIVYQTEQSAGLIRTSVIPQVFRPSNIRIVRCVIINGSAGGASSTNAIQDGFMKISYTGEITFSVSMDNGGVEIPFGGGATSGSANGVFQGVYTYSI